MSAVGKLLFIGSLAVSVISLLGCSRGWEGEGKLLYSGGDGAIRVAEFSASGGTDAILYLRSGVSAIDSLVRFDNGEIIFGECDNTGCKSNKIAPQAPGAVALRTGHLVSYLAHSQSLFFYDFSEDGDSWLFVADIGSPMSAEKIARKPEPRTLESGINRDIAVAPIPVSAREVIFVGPDAQLWIYNADSGSSDQLNVGFCYPYLWIWSTRQLLCGGIDSGVPYMLDIAMGRRKDIPDLKGGYGFFHVPQHNAIVYGKTRLAWLLHEASDVFMYSLDDGSKNRLGKDMHLRYGVWFDSKKKGSYMGYNFFEYGRYTVDQRIQLAATSWRRK